MEVWFRMILRLNKWGDFQVPAINFLRGVGN